MDTIRKIGFEPIVDEHSKVLILGSFPSVKSRETSFYYGHPRNRFWGMLSGYFGEEKPTTIAEKTALLYRRNVALWDIATSCEIQGSSDATLKKAEIADLDAVFNIANIQLILLNGKRAYNLFEKKYRDCGIPYALMPSTSPANVRYNQQTWYDAIQGVLSKE